MKSSRSVGGSLFAFASPFSLWQASVWKPLKASYGRTVLSIVAIALGVALGFSIDAMNQTATRELVATTRSVFGDADLVVQGTSLGFDENLYTAIARTNGVAVANPLLQIEAHFADHSDHSEGVTLLGMDLLRSLRMRTALPANNASTVRGKQGLSVFDSQSLMLSPAAAEIIHAHVGDTVTIQLGAQQVAFQVSQIVPQAIYPGAVGVLDIAAAQWRLGQLGKLSRIELKLSPTADAKRVIADIELLLPPDAKLTTSQHESQQSVDFVRGFTINMTALALVALFTGAFLVYSTQSLTVIRRRREFALLHAIGVTRRQQIGSVVLSGALLGCVGALLGIVLGMALAKLGMTLVIASVGMGLIPQIEFSSLQIGIYFLLGVAVSIAGSIAPAWSAARIPAAQALKAGDVDDDISRTNLFAPSTLCGLVLWFFAPLFLLLPPVWNLPLPGYTAIGFILLGAVLIIPAFMRQVIQWLPSHRNVLYRVAVAQLHGTANRAAISVGTILVSVSLMVAMAIMSMSLRHELVGSLERRLPADVYATAGTTSASYFDVDTVRRLSSTPGIEHVASVRTIEVLLAKDQAPVTLLAQSMLIKNVESMYSLESKAQHAIPENSVPIWISVSLADHYAISSDSTLTVPLAGRLVQCSVRGVWRDNYRRNDALLMDLQHYQKLTGDDRVTSLGLWFSAAIPMERTMELLRTRMPAGLENGLSIPSESRAKAVAAFDSVFAITYLLEGVAVLIGMFGISVSASAQALARRAEFGVLRHLGFTRNQIGRLLAVEGLGLGTLGVVAGFCVGCVISLVLIYFVGRQSFHWTMDIYVPTVPLLLLAGSIPLAAGLTSLWSGRGAMSADVVRAVKEDW